MNYLNFLITPIRELTEEEKAASKVYRENPGPECYKQVAMANFLTQQALEKNKKQDEIIRSN